jgi:transaldolase
MNENLKHLKVKLFADGADLSSMVEMAKKPLISGLTTNPTLMKKVGITDYEKFAKDVIQEIPDKSISFEVFSDDLKEMKSQAEKISSWGSNVYVKIPVTNTKGESTKDLVKDLSQQGIKINVTALMTSHQVEHIADSLEKTVPSYVSVFAGRIADTGVNPVPIMQESLRILSDNLKCELIWASPRELLNVFQANEIGCQIITATNDILQKLELIGKDLTEYSLETVTMFYRDGLAAGFEI